MVNDLRRGVKRAVHQHVPCGDVIRMEENSQGGWQPEHYELKRIDDSYAQDRVIQEDEFETTSRTLCDRALQQRRKQRPNEPVVHAVRLTSRRNFDRRNMRDRRLSVNSGVLDIHTLVPPLVPKLYLGTRLSAQLCCSAARSPSKIGNGIASVSAFPNGVWERGHVL